MKQVRGLGMSARNALPWVMFIGVVAGIGAACSTSPVVFREARGIVLMRELPEALATGETDRERPVVDAALLVRAGVQR